MLKLLPNFAIGILLIAGCTSSSSTSEQDEVSENNEQVVAKTQIRIEYTDEAHLAAAHLVARLIEVELRQPAIVEQASGAPLSEADIYLSSESQARPIGFSELIELDLGITRGWYIPRNLEESFPELSSWNDLTNPDLRSAFGLVEPEEPYQFVYLGQEAEIDAQVVAVTGLPITLNQIETVTDLEEYVEGQQAEDLAFLIVAESPNPAISTENFLRLETPIPELCPTGTCSYESVPLNLLTAINSENDLTKIEGLLSDLSVGPDQYSALSDAIVAAQSADLGVSNWVSVNLAELPKIDS